MKVMALAQRYFFVIMVGLVVTAYSRERGDVVSFDQLFPATSFSSVLKSCAQICSDIDILQACCDGQDQCTLLANALIGRMFRLEGAIDVLLNNYKQGSAEVRLDDLDYLATVIDFMEIAYNRIITVSEAEIVAHFMARKIKKKLENVLVEVAVSVT